REPIEEERRMLASMIEAIGSFGEIPQLANSLKNIETPLRRDIMASATKVLLAARDLPASQTAPLRQWKREQEQVNRRRYGSHLYSESAQSALKVPATPARYAENPPVVKGFEILNACFDAAFQ